jgi:hypothetical protein
MELKELIQRAEKIKQAYGQLEVKNCGRSWTIAERTQGLAGDVGNLMKLMMAKTGLRKIDGCDEKLEHELLDCLWSLIVISNDLGIDFEKLFPKWEAQMYKKIEKENLN